MSLNSLPPEQLNRGEALIIARQAQEDERLRHEAAIQARAILYLTAELSEESMAMELAACKADFFYWCENYAWLDEPRSTIQKIPALLYPFQVAAALKIMSMAEETLDTEIKHDILVEKTRDMGWSWLMDLIAVWYLIFHNRSVLFGSRKAELADKIGDMKSLLEKCRFIIKNLPDWMLPPGFNPDKNMGENLIRNPNGGAISADSASSDFGRGDRKFFIVLDEFASWAYDHASAQACSESTSCRIFISTPKGPFGKFAAMRKGTDKVKPEIITSHWTQHPTKSAGMSRDSDGKPTSPWYEERVAKLTPDEIASEIDINYATSARGLIFSDYNVEWHSKKGLKHFDNKPIIRVWDPGGEFCVLFMQVDSYRRVLVFREIHIVDAHIRDVANEVLYQSHKYFPDCEFIDYGDPNGNNRNNSAIDKPEFEVLRDEFDIYVDTTWAAGMPSNMKVKNRIIAIHNKLRESVPALKTFGLLVDPVGCPNLEHAMLEGYRYKIDSHTKRVLEVVAEEHPYEDVVDCLGMGILAELGLGTKAVSTTNVKVEKNIVSWGAYARRKRSG